MQAINYDEKIIDVLKVAKLPLDTEKIRNETGISHWNTALKHCLELVIANKIQGLKTSKSWVFWVEKEDFQNES